MMLRKVCTSASSAADMPEKAVWLQPATATRAAKPCRWLVSEEVCRMRSYSICVIVWVPESRSVLVSTRIVLCSLLAW